MQTWELNSGILACALIATLSCTLLQQSDCVPDRGSQDFPSPERPPTPLTRDPPGPGWLWPRSSAWGLGFCSFCYFCCAISVRRHSGCAGGFVGRQERQRLITAPRYVPHFPFPLSSLLSVPTFILTLPTSSLFRSPQLTLGS